MYVPTSWETFIRTPLRHLAVLAALALLAACDAPSRVPPVRAPGPAAADDMPPALASDAPLEFVERVTGGAAPTDVLPMIVAMHGMGDTPEHAFETMYASFPLQARFILPRAPLPYGNGFSWFPFRAADRGPAALAPEMVRAADRVDALVTRLAAERPTSGVRIAVGFSQGGMLSYVLGVRHGEHYASTFPVSGFLPTSLVPAHGGCGARIAAMHGDADDVVPLAWDEEGSAALAAAHCNVALDVVPGLHHEVTPELLARLYAEMRGVMAPRAGPGAPHAAPVPTVEQPASSQLFVLPRIGAPGVPPRDVLVRVPDVPEGTKLPVLFVYDGELAFDVLGVDDQVDALVAAHLTRPWIIVAVPSVDRTHELADDAERTAAFLADVVLPEVAQIAPVDARRESIAIAGFSYGGLAAVRAALSRPDTFGRMIAMSPSLWWHGHVPTQRFASRRARLPLRAWIDVGTNEQRNPDAPPYMTDDARALRDVLLRRGMRFGDDLGYREDLGSPHGFAYAGRRMRWALAFALSDVDLSGRSPDDVSLTAFGPRHEGRVSVEAHYGENFRLTWPEHDAHLRRDGDFVLAEIEGVTGHMM